MSDKNKENPEQVNPNIKKAKVYTMPSKFYVEESNRKEGKNIFLIGAIIFLIVAIGGAAVYIFLLKDDTTEVVVNQNDNTTINSNKNKNVNNSNSNINSNVNVNTNSAQNSNTVNINTNTTNNANIDVFANLNTNTTTNFNTNTTINSSLDSDFDDLTDVEEVLYGTNTALADTDSDGYVDGLELSGGYDPSGSGRLENSNKVRFYSDSDYNFSLLYPTAWAVGADPLNVGGKIFTSGEEFVTVSIQENPAELSATEWYIAKSPGINSSLIDKVMNWDKTLSGALSLDGMTVYYTQGSKAYVISYNINILSEASYQTTFEMMYKSFVASVVSDTSNNLLNTNTVININSNTNANSNGNTNSNTNSNTNINNNSNTNSEDRL